MKKMRRNGKWLTNKSQKIWSSAISERHQTSKTLKAVNYFPLTNSSSTMYTLAISLRQFPMP